ncbi:MAG: hypothetical protein GWN81_12165 [Phycisphaerae bacterium]|nr:hypothetical protein [Phycisphaerae bacterium]
MSRPARLLGVVSWKHAFAEVMLIFVGISLALAADAWNDRRQDREDEAELLSEIAASLRNDFADVESALSYVEEKDAHLKRLEDHIRNGLPYADELAISFSFVRTWQTSRLNTAAYEALKYRGLGVVSDRALRIRLIGFFDDTRILIEDRDRIDRFEVQNYVEPYFQENFVVESDSFDSVPIDYDAVISDQRFLNLLALRTQVHRSLTAPAYRDLLKQTEALISQIENHMDIRK